MSINFAANLNKMITAGLGGAMDAPESNVAIGFRYTEKTASGNPISFSDGAGGKPVKALEIGFSPVQDLNGYDHPWPAGGGENKLPSLGATTTIAYVTWTLNDDGSVTLSGTASANSNYDFGRTEGITIPAGTWYTREPSLEEGYRITVFGIVNGTPTVIKSGGGTFTTTEELTVFVRCSVPSGTTVNTTFYPMLVENGSSSTEYSSYSNICPISGWSQLELHHADDTEEIQLGATYYAGTVDVVSGEGTITHAIVDMGDLTWTYNSSNEFFRTTITGRSSSSAVLSSIYKYGGDQYDSAMLNNVPNGSICMRADAIKVKDTRYTDADVYKTAVAGQTICYELDTPIPITITPQEGIVTQEGGNIFITDANGNMTITYTAVGYVEGY